MSYFRYGVSKNQAPSIDPHNSRARIIRTSTKRATNTRNSHTPQNCVGNPCGLDFAHSFEAPGAAQVCQVVPQGRTDAQGPSLGAAKRKLEASGRWRRGGHDSVGDPFVFMYVYASCTYTYIHEHEICAHAYTYVDMYT